MRRYAYVGPPEVLARHRGDAAARAVTSRAALAEWIQAHERSLRAEGFAVTYVVTVEGALRVAPRRSEHVACAGGGEVLAAGEATLSRDAKVVEASNLSTGYCPEPACWTALAEALDRAEIPRPAGFAHEMVFRRCEACGQRNVVRDDHFACAACDAPLPARWNFDASPREGSDARPPCMTDTDRCLRTARLDLVAATRRHVDAELQDRDALARLLGARVPASWPPGEYDRDAQAFFRAQLLADPARVGWLTWYAITRHPDGTRDTLVAGAGFFGPPAEGAVEVGYSVVPEARGRGVATEVVGALVAFAFSHPGVDRVVAHTTDENVASTKVLQRNGFHRVGAGAEAGSVAYVTRRAG